MKAEIFQDSIKALDNSIQHWKRNVKPEEYLSTGAHECACCNLYKNWENDCVACPIMLVTKDIYCRATNYSKISHTGHRFGYQSIEVKRLANHMLSELYEIRRQFIGKYRP